MFGLLESGTNVSGPAYVPNVRGRNGEQKSIPFNGRPTISNRDDLSTASNVHWLTARYPTRSPIALVYRDLGQNKTTTREWQWSA